MAKFLIGLSEIYSEPNLEVAAAMRLCRLANMGGLCRLRDGKNTDCDDNAPFCLPEAEEHQERDRSGRVREFGFGSRESLYRDRKDRRASRARGHRAGKK